MTLAPTTIVLWPAAGVGTERPPETPDAHVIRLHDLSVLSDLWIDARIPIATATSLRAGATFHAAATVSIATAPRLNVRSRFTTATGITISDTAALTIIPILAARTTISVATVAPLTIIPALAARPTLSLTLAAAGLIAPVRFAAAATLSTSVPLAKLSRVAQVFSAQASIGIRANSNLVLIGKGASDVMVTFNGAETSNVRVHSIQIADILNEAPNTATFLVDDRNALGPPAIGTDVKIGLQNTLSQNLLFAGTVKSSEQSYDSLPSHPVWSVRCDDYTFLINRRKVVGTWTNISASQVATDIVTRFTTGFSPAGIVGGLPAITCTFVGESVMDALTQVANLAGAYAAGPDYNRVVYLFVTDPRPAPLPVTAGSPLLMLQTPVTRTLDVTQTRTRVDVKGAATNVGGPADFNIGPEFGQLPLEDSKLFTPGTSGQVLTADAQIVNYTDVSPGGLATILRGNVPPPAGAPLAAIAAGTAGGLQGTGYQWKIVFANALGETEPGPPSTPPLTCHPFPAPPRDRPVGVGVSPAQVGPLAGTYQYAVSFVTSKGETLLGPTTSFVAAGIGPPGYYYGQSVGDASRAGPLLAGSAYGYKWSYLTTYGETEPTGDVIYRPSTLGWPWLYNVGQYDFGGLQNNSSYVYGVSLVTTFGETIPWTTTIQTISESGWPGNCAFTGYFDANGRMDWGQYYWAATYYSDQFGETRLGPGIFNTPSGTPPPAGTKQRIGIAIPGLSSRADGIRIYRAIAGSSYQLEMDYRRGNVPSSYLSYISQGECGNTWPNHQLRYGGVAVAFGVASAQSPDVLGRRIYRSKANGSDLYLLAEIQHNTETSYFDTAFDSALTARSPIATTTGRAAIVSLPYNPGVPSYTGFVGRRVYRTKANNSVYYRLADVKEMTSTSFIDDTPDSALTGEGPANPSTAGGAALLISGIPLGPTGTLARRLYRTTANGTQLRRLTEIADNTTQSYLDVIPDATLSATLPPYENTAGAAAVQLTQIPVGGPSVTQRLIYRNKARGPDLQPTAFQYVDTINNNTDQTYLDSKADADLGRMPVPTSTIGALPGETSVIVASAAGWPQSGWFQADSQTVRYNGISVSPWGTGDTLLNIPPLLQIVALSRQGQVASAQTASAHGFTVGQRVVVLGATQQEYNGTRTVTQVPNAIQFSYVVNAAPASPATPAPGQQLWTSAAGAITGAIAGGTTVLSTPMLTGVSGIGVALPVGSNISLWVVCDSAAGQQALAALEGGDGIHEYLVSDGDLKSIADCRNRGLAELALFQYVQVSIDYVTRDTRTRSGAMVSITLPAPTNISGSFRIQEVRIDQIDVAMRLAPRYTVHCSTSKFSLMDLLRHVVLSQDHAA